LKQFLFEEKRRIDLLWKIVKYRASLVCCFNLLRKTRNAFLFNEAILKFAKLPRLIKLKKKRQNIKERKLI
jgi:hypothetical protein